ncbi:hypothetical protein JJV70_04445 [Streptomyces sp. JJ66]|uniref:hypothetical protein n=1 Tax=Streptomyces sp. JJ66 TaxID=2803843 RepID=UPI001C560EF1|nr:hypothetical protein [Streptomyces sp. JJ66]MBW1601365.1 hypothetical protein [Streptomyces sp. JJ66]
MTAVAVEITPRPVEEPTTYPTSPEPTGLVIVDDVEALTEGTAAACNDDNPYR